MRKFCDRELINIKDLLSVVLRFLADIGKEFKVEFLRSGYRIRGNVGDYNKRYK